VEEGFTAKAQRAQREVVNEALNSKHEIRKEETQPRMNANRREWGKSYWLFVIGYWGKRKERLFDFLTNNH
jgi:hypothetical protein